MAWIADYRDQHGKRHIKTFQKKRDAADFHRMINQFTKPSFASARLAARKMADDLAWRGPSGKTRAHVKLTRVQALSLLAILPTVG